MVFDGEPNPVRARADYPMPYHTAFKDLITRLRETTKAAAELLRLCTLFGPGPLPLALLRALPAAQVSPAMTALLENPSQLELAVAKLVQRSVVRVESEALWMCRFVREAVRRPLPEDRRAKAALDVRAALVAADPGRPEDPTVWPRYAELLPFLEPSGVLEWPDAASRRLVLDFLRYLALSGDYATGIHIAERAVGAGDAAATDPDLMVRRATLLRETGDYAGAEALDRSVLVGLLEADAPGALVAMARLAGDLRGLGRYVKAHELSCQACDLCAARFPEEGVNARIVGRSLSRSLRMLGRYAEAAEWSRKTLESSRDALGPTAPSTLLSETDLAYDLRLSGRFEEALELQGRSVARHREVFGDDYPGTLLAAYHWGLCEDWCGEAESGLVRIREAWEGAERVLGPEAPLTLMFASGLGGALRRAGALDRAAEVSGLTVARYSARLGERHPYAIGARAHHALVLGEAGERKPARETLEVALAGMTAILGPGHPWTVGIAVNATAVHAPADVVTLSRAIARRATEVLGERRRPLWDFEPLPV